MGEKKMRETTAPAAHHPETGDRPGPPVVIELPVRFAETDAMGVVHHSNYVIWFEAARVAWMDAARVPYTEFAASGHHFAVTAVQVEYRAPARFGDTVRITAAPGRLRSRHVSFHYTVHNARDGALLAAGHTEHVCVDLDGHMARIPQPLLARLEAGMAALAAVS